MATLLEIRNLLLEKTGKDLFVHHARTEEIIEMIIDSCNIGDGHIDYANLLEEVISFCEDQLTYLGFRELEFEDEENPN